MVDPNRKINRLSDRDVKFLDECESEFASRYTTDDAEFMAHCSKPEPEPPLVDNWMSGGGGGGGGSGGGADDGYTSPFNNRYNGGQRRGGGDRGWQRRGGGYNNHNSNNERGFRDQRRNRYEARGGGGGGGGGDRTLERSYQHRSRNESPQGGSPMHVRRDYGNFVPASKD
ncbi:RNA guanine-N7 methyltransferase activating subunit [Drosophila virilis]|uniref:Uncharacterized protein n=1 Tax=Drosophila virilis TaxID=7244 RepID=B4LBW5_DROVI|nr:ATP-dependent RNA helicase laf-1 [Drosophila virilis]EDW69765.1 uncharacterized protein Dvir_GJ11939 [Drosophila virilis]